MDQAKTKIISFNDSMFCLCLMFYLLNYYLSFCHFYHLDVGFWATIQANLENSVFSYMALSLFRSMLATGSKHTDRGLILRQQFKRHRCCLFIIQYAFKPNNTIIHLRKIVKHNQKPKFVLFAFVYVLLCYTAMAYGCDNLNALSCLKQRLFFF